MKKYDSYTNSGVEWIGEIPSGWSKSKFKYLTTKNVQYGVNSSSENYTDDGIRFIRTTDIDDFGNLKQEGVFVNQNDIDESQITDYLDFLISRSGTLGRTYLHKSDERMTYGGYLVRFNFGCLTTSKFLQYYCCSTNFWDWISLNTIISTIGNVNGQKYNNMDIPLPPISEQQQIVSFLDTKTSLIDSLIEKTHSKIDLLKEKRTCLINEAVTKGLNPDAEMKDSGVEWIGEIPSDWTFSNFRYCIDVLTDFTANGSFASLADNVDYLDSGFSRLVRLTDLRNNLNNDGIYVSEKAHKFLSKSELKGGELLIANVGAYAGLVTLMPRLKGFFTLGPNMFLLKLNQNHKYFSYLLSSSICAEQLKIMAVSSAQPKLNKDN